MKALLIKPDQRSIEEIQIDGPDDIVALIGYDTVTSDEIGPDGDRLFFDEECFLRGTSGRFQIDTVVPVSGVGIVVGATDDSGEQLRDTVSDAQALAARIKYL